MSKQDYTQRSPDFTPVEAGFGRGSARVPVTGVSPNAPSIGRTPIPKCSNELCSRRTFATCVFCGVYYCSKPCMILGYENHTMDCITVPPHSMDASQQHTSSYQQPISAHSAVNNQFIPANPLCTAKIHNTFPAEVVETAVKCETQAANVDSTVSSNNNEAAANVTAGVKRVSFGNGTNKEGNQRGQNGRTNDNEVANVTAGVKRISFGNGTNKEGNQRGQNGRTENNFDRNVRDVGDDSNANEQVLDGPSNRFVNKKKDGNKNKHGGDGDSQPSDEKNDSFPRRGNRNSLNLSKNSDNGGGNDWLTRANQNSDNSGSNKSGSRNNKFNDNGPSSSTEKYRQRQLTFLKAGNHFNMRIMELDINDKGTEKDIIAITVTNDEPIYQDLYDTLCNNVIDEEVETLEKGKIYVCQKDGRWARAYVISVYDNEVLIRYSDLENSVRRVPKNILREYPSQCDSLPPAVKRARFVDGTTKDDLRTLFEEGKALDVEVVEYDKKILSLKLLPTDVIKQRLNRSQSASGPKRNKRDRNSSEENSGEERQTRDEQNVDESNEQNSTTKRRPDLNKWFKATPPGTSSGNFAHASRAREPKSSNNVGRNPTSSKKSNKTAAAERSFDSPAAVSRSPTVSSSTSVKPNNQNKLSIKLAGEIHEVLVTTLCEDPTCFYVADDPGIMEMMTGKMETIDAAQLKDINNPTVGSKCLSSYDGGWYRGEVVDLNPTRVFYIDYGNTEEVANTTLKEVPKDFELIGVPPQAKKVKLEVGNVKQFGIDVYSSVKIKIVCHEEEYIVGSVGETKEVMVLSPNYNDDDKVHVLSEENQVKMREIVNLPTIPLKNVPSVGSLVLTDYDEIICRAKVLRTDPLAVEFIDYGGEAEVEKSNLFELSGPWSKEPPLSFLVPKVEGVNIYERTVVIKKIGQDEWQFLK